MSDTRHKLRKDIKEFIEEIEMFEISSRLIPESEYKRNMINSLIITKREANKILEQLNGIEKEMIDNLIKRWKKEKN